MEAHFYQRFVLEASPATEAAAAAAAQGGGGAVAKVVTTPRSAMLAVRKTLAMAEGAQRQLLDPTERDALTPVVYEWWQEYMAHFRYELEPTVAASTIHSTLCENMHKRRKHGGERVQADQIPAVAVEAILGWSVEADTARDDEQLLEPSVAASAPIALPLPTNNNNNNSKGLVTLPSFKANQFDYSSGDDDAATDPGQFVTAREQLKVNQMSARARGGNNRGSHSNGHSHSSASSSRGRALGARGHRGKFMSPLSARPTSHGATEEDSLKSDLGFYNLNPPSSKGSSSSAASGSKTPEITDERLKNIEPKMIELISNEMLDRSPQVSWDDIAGLEHAKKSIREIVVWPMLRPDIFTGLRGPPKGLLLFGPPGTGKTLIGKCIASQAKATFFSISASSLTSKWVGEGEKMVRALFAVARCHQPAVIFIDEIDSLLSQRTDGEMEANRRIKTEFLVQLDGAATSSEDRILIVGATNRPHEIDEAARRRLVKRLYIPLPEDSARGSIVLSLLSNQKHSLSESEIAHIVAATAGYSGSDMANLCREAALGPIRTIKDISCISADDVRPIQLADFQYALTQVRASVSDKDLKAYEEWNKTFGSLSL